MNAFIFALNVHTGVPIDFITHIDVSFESLHTYRCICQDPEKVRDRVTMFVCA